MNIEIIQSSSSSISSVYIVHDYLYNKNYLNSLKEIVSNAIETDTTVRRSNVQAVSTGWQTLLKIKEMENLHIRILETLNCIYKLRSPAPNSVVNFNFDSSWGMKHKKGDFTLEHVHVPYAWSGAFYLDVPCDTYMNFPDFNQAINLKSNMLLLFPGTTKHSVSEHTSEQERVSMAFNINWHN